MYTRPAFNICSAQNTTLAHTLKNTSVHHFKYFSPLLSNLFQSTTSFQVQHDLLKDYAQGY